MHAKAISADIANYDLVSALRGLPIPDDNVDGKSSSFGASNQMDQRWQLMIMIMIVHGCDIDFNVDHKSRDNLII